MTNASIRLLAAPTVGPADVDHPVGAGGPGRGIATGNGGTDVCHAETRIRCETP